MARRALVPSLALTMVAATALVACTAAPSPTPTPTPTRSGSPTAGAGLDGTEVSVLGLWSGPEYDAFATVASAWEQATGGSVDWHGTQDPSAALDALVQAGDPPEIAVLPNLALVQQLADDGRLVPLDGVLDMDQVGRDYAPAWLDLGSRAGSLYGIFVKVTDKSTVWYSPSAFATAGYAVPETWQDLTALADTMVADGRTPFSMVAQSGAASGWPLTDWISALVLTGCGPDVYDRWVAAEIPWTDPCIRRSFETFAHVVGTPGYVVGGVPGILATTDAEGASPLFTDPPAAFMYPMASFAQAFIAAEHPDLQAGVDYNAFPFPAVEPQNRGAVTIGADVVVMVTDTPAARSFMAYLAGAQAQQTWVELGGFTSVNRSVPAGAYPDPVASTVAERLIGAQTTRFGAGDMMPAALQRAWWAAMLTLVQRPATLDSALAELTDAAQAAL